MFIFLNDMLIMAKKPNISIAYFMELMVILFRKFPHHGSKNFFLSFITGPSYLLYLLAYQIFMAIEAQEVN